MIPADAAVPVGALCAALIFTGGYWLGRRVEVWRRAAVQAELDARRVADEKAAREVAYLRRRLGIDPCHSSYCPCQSCTALAPVGVIKAGSAAIEGGP